jgi:hypothetical protein
MVYTDIKAGHDIIEWVNEHLEQTRQYIGRAKWTGNIIHIPDKKVCKLVRLGDTVQITGRDGFKILRNRNRG